MKDYITNQPPSSIGGLLIGLVSSLITMLIALGIVELTAEQVTAILAFVSALILATSALMDYTFDKYKEYQSLKQDS